MAEENKKENKLNGIDVIILKEEIIDAIKTCYDPEIPVNIFELGLIYIVNLDNEGNVEVKMTLTSPMCPAAQSLPAEVKQKVSEINGIKNVNVEIVWEPRWNSTMMTEEARLTLNI